MRLYIIMKLVLQISTGVVIGNLVTIAIAASLMPYFKFERRLINPFFSRN